MKTTKWLAGILVGGSLVLAGCSKSQPQQQVKQMEAKNSAK
jgi:outer membrane murein-binding lipoprotein Lpp